MPADPDVTIRQVTHRRGARDWLSVPYTVFAGIPHWVAPLHIHARRRLNPHTNAFSKFGDVGYFVAYRDGVPIGRISAQVNRRHLEFHRDDTGHFGYFDCVNDEAAARALVTAAAHWLKERGLRRMQGPFNLTINEDCGLLISGFDAPPAIMSSHAPPWAGLLLERCGLDKTIDLYAYRVRPTDIPPPIVRLAKLAQDSGRVRTRAFDLAHYARDVALVFDIFNDAWSNNRGFVPIGEDEIKALVSETRSFMRSEFGCIVEIDGVPAAMAVALPDINSIIAPFRGRLLPFNWIRLLHGLWSNVWTSARVPLLGIRQSYRGTPIAAGILSLLISHLLKVGRSYNLDWVEFSWILETNTPMVKLAELAAGPPSKIYRIYSASL